MFGIKLLSKFGCLDLGHTPVYTGVFFLITVFAVVFFLKFIAVNVLLFSVKISVFPLEILQPVIKIEKKKKNDLQKINIALI